MTTTIKLSESVRDRLKVQAAAAGRTLGQQVEYLVELGERQERFAELKRAVAATSSEAAASYHEETADWDRIENG